MTRRGLVIGYGSIGQRHARVLESLGLSISIVSRRGQGGGRPVFPSIAEARSAGSYELMVVADETARHADSLAQIVASGHDGSVLVEKPLFAEKSSLAAHRFRFAGVGYHLRFHPVIEALKAVLTGRAVQMANFYVGQHLGDWRLDRIAANTYSASRAAGGGALRDLSHELDLATWLLGPWSRVAAIGGRLGTVTVDADDGWGILLSCARCPVVTMELNCLDRAGRRSITVQAEGETMRADLMAGTLEVGGQMQSFSVERDQVYSTMHQALMDGSKLVCTFDEGARVVELIEAVETATRERRWVERPSA
jgi:predicted dehydrogenase